MNGFTCKNFELRAVKVEGVSKVRQNKVVWCGECRRLKEAAGAARAGQESVPCLGRSSARISHLSSVLRLSVPPRPASQPRGAAVPCVLCQYAAVVKLFCGSNNSTLLECV